jgi:sugar phosphate isomerase/epimerase
MKLLGTLCLGLAALTAFAADPIPDTQKINGFALGCQAYTFNRFSVMEAIEKTAYAGGKVIEFFPGQKLSTEQAEVKFGHEPEREVAGADGKKKKEKLSPEDTKAVWEKVKAKCKEHGITPIAYGVVGLSKKEEESRRVFDFAKALGIRVINTESVDALDTFEKLAKEYDIKVGFHNHPKRPQDPNYRVWDPNYILEITKDRDAHIGACADIGHWVRSGLKPLECVRILKGRIVSSHMKDLHAPLPSGHDVHWGQGVSDVPAVLAEYREQRFEGPISVEYEFNWENNAEDAKACIEFVKNWTAPKK